MLIKKKIETLDLAEITNDLKNAFCFISAGKGNYWTLDPNCEKMFDNGNFRRKRKRKSDPLAEDEGKSYSGTDSDLNSPKDDASERENSPITTSSTPCLNGFITQMGDVVSGSGRDTLLPLLDESHRASPTGVYGSYSPNATVPQWDTHIPPPLQSNISSSPNQYSNSYSDSILNQFTSQAYPMMGSTDLLYAREGTEV